MLSEEQKATQMIYSLAFLQRYHPDSQHCSISLRTLLLGTKLRFIISSSQPKEPLWSKNTLDHGRRRSLRLQFSNLNINYIALFQTCVAYLHQNSNKIYNIIDFNNLLNPELQDYFPGYAFSLTGNVLRASFYNSFSYLML